MFLTPINMLQVTVGHTVFSMVDMIWKQLKTQTWHSSVKIQRGNPTEIKPRLMSYRSVLNVSNGGPSNPKLTQNKQPSDKAQSLQFFQLDVKRIPVRFQNQEKKRKWFFDHSNTLTVWIKCSKVHSKIPTLAMCSQYILQQAWLISDLLHN